MNELTNIILNNATTSDIGNINIGRKRVYSKIDKVDVKYDENGNKTESDYLCSIILKLIKYNDDKFNILYVNISNENDATIGGNDITTYDLLAKVVTFDELKNIEFTNNWKDLI